MIPVRNIYYLLCYAWNRLDEADLLDVGSLPQNDLPNLLGRILVAGTNRLLRQGVDRSYVSASQDTQNPKGKIDVGRSVKRGLILHNVVTCEVDELSRDILHNRILKTTIHRLALTAGVAPELAHELRLLERQLGEITFIPIRAEHFARVQLHRNNAFYRFLLHVCELCFFALLADEGGTGYRFRDFVRDEARMCKVFQDFIYNFYRLEQHVFSVSSERFGWDTTFTTDRAKALLPEMNTDVCLEAQARKIVIECKFTPHVLQEHWGKWSARSEHLYQLFAYLKHLEQRGGVNVHSEGLLLYPTATEAIDLLFDTHGHSLRVVTVDLRKNWTDIKNQLLRLLVPWKQDIDLSGQTSPA
jgi:5-methylcytosine-specific restriction enzyme subunit McrC